jgi:hypothetical protein
MKPSSTPFAIFNQQSSIGPAHYSLFSSFLFVSPFVSRNETCPRTGCAFLKSPIPNLQSAIPNPQSQIPPFVPGKKFQKVTLIGVQRSAISIPPSALQSTILNVPIN